MRVRRWCWAAGACLAACGGGSDVAWRGEAPHLYVSGFIDGETVELDYDATTVEAVELACTREYRIPLIDGEPDRSQARNVEIEIEGTVEIGGEIREFQIELKHHDTQSDPPGTELLVVPRDELRPPDIDDGVLWVEWEWKDELGNDLYERAAQAGTLVVHAFTGTPEAEGVIIPPEDGVIGLTIDAYWSPAERLRISLTAPCTDNDIEEVAQ